MTEKLNHHSQYIIDINEWLDDHRETLENACQTEYRLVADHLETLQNLAEDDDCSRADYLGLLADSLRELVAVAQGTLKDLEAAFGPIKEAQ